MAKLRKDVRVELEGAVAQGKAGKLTLKTYPATVSVTKALQDVGVDASAMQETMKKLSKHDLKALEDKTLTPGELQIPKPVPPDSFDDERHANLAVTYAKSINSDREDRWKRGLGVATIVAGLVGAAIGSLITALLK